MRQLRYVLLAVLWMATLTVLHPGVALAHEQRTIAGKYDVEVGWDREPTYVNQPNAATIYVTRASNHEGIAGLEKTLQLKIAYGGNTPKAFALRPVFTKKGLYLADIIPTKAGSYIFNFVGTIEDTPVDEKFESGPGRFDDVMAVDQLEFPQAALDGQTLASDLKAARDEANTARLLAMGGLVTGILGLIVGGVALVRRKG
jgi:hypothetical protein